MEMRHPCATNELWEIGDIGRFGSDFRSGVGRREEGGGGGGSGMGRERRWRERERVLLVIRLPQKGHIRPPCCKVPSS